MGKATNVLSVKMLAKAEERWASYSAHRFQTVTGILRISNSFLGSRSGYKFQKKFET